MEGYMEGYDKTSLLENTYLLMTKMQLIILLDYMDYMYYIDRCFIVNCNLKGLKVKYEKYGTLSTNFYQKLLKSIFKSSALKNL